MIKLIELELFKCFELLKLPVSELTLLSGTNASGKSTVLQALVLLHQTILDHEWSTRLQLNGSELQLGTVTDVIDKVHGRREFKFGLQDGEVPIVWSFEYADDKQAMSANVVAVRVGEQIENHPERLRYLLPENLAVPASLAERLLNLSYLTAERVGPRDSYRLQDPSATQVVGPRGENTVGLLYQKRDSDVIEALRVNNTPPTLRAQVEARMAIFFPGLAIDLQPVPQANMVTLGVKNSLETGFHRPMNVGFGITQVLPIVVAALTAKNDDLLLIENPEVHLHPAGQAMMGEFLAEVASAGVQVLVESHSDHILSGMRRAVKKGVLEHAQLSLHYFNPRDSNAAQVTSPVIDADGNLDHWPEGFFDQFDKDLNYFAGWGE